MALQEGGSNAIHALPGTIRVPPPTPPETRRPSVPMSHHTGLRTRGFFMKRCQPSVTCTALQTDEPGLGGSGPGPQIASRCSSGMPEPLTGCWPPGERTCGAQTCAHQGLETTADARNKLHVQPGALGLQCIGLSGKTSRVGSLCPQDLACGPICDARTSHSAAVSTPRVAAICTIVGRIKTNKLTTGGDLGRTPPHQPVNLHEQNLCDGHRVTKQAETFLHGVPRTSLPPAASLAR